MAVALRGRALWLPPVLLFAGVVLLGSLAYAIANLDRGEESLPPAPATPGGDTGSASFGPTGAQFQLIWQVAIATIFIAAVLAVALGKLLGGKLGNTVSVWELVGYAFGIGVVGGLVIFWPVIVGAVQSLVSPTGQIQPPSPGGGSGGTTIPTSTAFPIAVVIFGVLVVAVYLFSLSSTVLPRVLDLVREREPERGKRRREAAKAVRRTLLDLEAGTDFRTAVMACYQRMCSVLATRGVARQEALTPREIEGLALSELGLSRASVDDLTSLFEEARYSEHEIGPAQRDRAVDCLNAIRMELVG